MSKEGLGKLPVVDSDKDVMFKIEPEDVADAECGSPSSCVVARALTRALGPFFEKVFVGSKITKVRTDTKIIRFVTSSALSRAIPVFDRTGQWCLAPGEYQLFAPTPSRRLGGSHKNREKKKYGDRPSGFHPRMTASRVVERCTILQQRKKPHAALES